MVGKYVPEKLPENGLDNINLYQVTGNTLEMLEYLYFGFYASVWHY